MNELNIDLIKSALSEVKEPLLNKQFKFAFIRNPWDWYVSHYFYLCKKSGIKRGVSPKTYSTIYSFEEYMSWGVTGWYEYAKDVKWYASYKFWFSCLYKRMCFVNGEDSMDYIGKFENMEESVNEILEACSVTPEITYQDFYDKAGASLFNSTKHKHYSHYYNDEMIDLVYENDKEIIDRFGYEYEVR